MVHSECIIIKPSKYSYFNDMPAFEILKRIKKLPILEPTEQRLCKEWLYIYRDKIDEFIESINNLGLKDKLSWIYPKYETDKYHKKGIDALSIYEILVLISANTTTEKYCNWKILDHVQNWDFKNRVIKLKILSRLITKENINTPKWAKLIYWLTKDIRRFKPLFSCNYTYAKTMPDIPHFYIIIEKLNDKNILVLFDRFKKYLNYFWKTFSRNNESCKILEHNNYYYRIHKELLYRIPTNLKTFEEDIKNTKLDTYFWSLEEITKNQKTTIDKIKKWEQLTPIKHNRSWTIYEDWHIERHNWDKRTNY